MAAHIPVMNLEGNSKTAIKVKFSTFLNLNFRVIFIKKIDCFKVKPELLNLYNLFA